MAQFFDILLWQARSSNAGQDWGEYQFFAAQDPGQTGCQYETSDAANRRQQYLDSDHQDQICEYCFSLVGSDKTVTLNSQASSLRPARPFARQIL